MFSIAGWRAGGDAGHAVSPIAQGHPRIDPRPHDPAPRHPNEASRVDIALLLDTSNSMDGLIHQAKSQLWAIVQEFARARRGGRAPTLRVALFEYGNTNLPATEGYIRQVVPLTDDLDRLSQALFGLTTQGGDEYCGQVIDEAITRLDWAGDRHAYKAIFIAGNEPFTQGEVHYRSAAERAVNHGVIVNTIHCGRHDEGIHGLWADGARAGRGEFFNIDQDRRIPMIRCPQDPRLGELNNMLNETYLWYGKERDALAANQRAQDENAGAMGDAAAAQRAAVKAGAAYRNTGRDLVDTYAQDPEILAKLEVEDLPPEMQPMTREEQRQHIESMSRKRAEVQAEVARLAAERDIYVREQLAREAGEGGEKTLGEAVVEAVRRQLREAGYDVEK
jgi:hypothetical protein